MIETSEQPRGGGLLRAEGLSRHFDGVRAVSDVSMAFDAGALTGLIGPNGAGKSTVLAMLAGTLESSAGRVVLDAVDVTGLAVHQRAKLGIVRTFQQTSEFPSLTVTENLIVAAKGVGGESLRSALFGRRQWKRWEEAAVERARDLLADFNLTQYADTVAGSLSGGQRRLVEVMRALMAEPRILLLDEPMAGVHPALAEQLGDHLVRLRDGGMTIVMVEHELNIVERLCDVVYVMADGEVIAHGGMEALRSNPEVVEAYLVG